MSACSRKLQKPPESGAVAVEFAIVVTVFLLLVFGITEFGRVLFTWNAAVEATRRGARTAIVSNINDPAILRSMQEIMPALQPDQITLTYLPAGCEAATCQYVTVEIGRPTAVTVAPIFIPVAPLDLPAFTTTLPRESLGQNT